MQLNDFEQIKDYPIILCGHPKSGTTLLLSLLDNHTQLSVFPEEFKFFQKVYDKRNPVNIILTETEFNALRFEKVVFPSGERDYTDVDFDYVEKEMRTLCRNADTFKDILIGAIGIWHNVQANKLTKKLRWVEKTPGNERYIYRYNQWFGKNIIYFHVLRDPRDNFATYKKKHPGLTVENFALNWAVSTKIALWAHKRFSNFHFVKYESLVQEPAKGVQRLCKILNIKKEESLFLPTRNGKPWRGNSMYGTKFDSISSKSVGRYKNNLNNSEISYMENVLSKYLKLFGYSDNKRFGASPVSFGLKVKKNMFLWHFLNQSPQVYFLLRRLKGLFR